MWSDTARALYQMSAALRCRPFKASLSPGLSSSGSRGLTRCVVVPRRNLPAKIGDVLTPEQYKEVEELGILVDKDDQVRLGQTVAQVTTLAFKPSEINARSNKESSFVVDPRVACTCFAGGADADLHKAAVGPAHCVCRDHPAHWLRAEVPGG